MDSTVSEPTSWPSPKHSYNCSGVIITNQIGRSITGIRRDVQMKDVFVTLRRKDLIEQVPGKRGRATAWRKKPQRR